MNCPFKNSMWDGPPGNESRLQCDQIMCALYVIDGTEPGQGRCSFKVIADTSKGNNRAADYINNTLRDIVAVLRNRL